MDSNRWYLSFARPDVFLGGCVVEADSLELAVQEATRLGINPGGEVLGFNFTWDCPFPIGQLLGKTELNRYLGNVGSNLGRSLRDLAPEDLERIREQTGMVRLPSADNHAACSCGRPRVVGLRCPDCGARYEDSKPVDEVIKGWDDKSMWDDLRRTKKQ